MQSTLYCLHWFVTGAICTWTIYISLKILVYYSILRDKNCLTYSSDLRLKYNLKKHVGIEPITLICGPGLIFYYK